MIVLIGVVLGVDINLTVHLPVMNTVLDVIHARPTPPHPKFTYFQNEIEILGPSYTIRTYGLLNL